MATIIERDSSSTSSALLIFILFAVLIVGGLWFAYTNGMVGNKTVIHDTTVLVPSPAPAPPAK